MKTCLIVVAHADDELLWCHPFLLDRNLHRKVLVCCSDKNNPARQSYRRGEEALAEVCADVGVDEYKVMSKYFSEFYKLRTRGPGEGPILMDWWNEAQSHVAEMMQDCDFIATHSPVHGNYGHRDHLLVTQMVWSIPSRPVIKWADICTPTTTWPIPHMTVPSEPERHIFSADPLEFARLKQHYVSRDCWTWSRDEQLSCDVVTELKR